MKKFYGVFLFLALSFWGMAGCCSASQTGSEAETVDLEQSGIGSGSSALPEAEERTGNSVMRKEDAETDKMEYDRSEQWRVVVLKDGDAFVGGTYTAAGDDESVLDASGKVTAGVTGAVINKISGNASGADEASFYGINSAIRVYALCRWEKNNVKLDLEWFAQIRA